MVQVEPDPVFGPHVVVDYTVQLISPVGPESGTLVMQNGLACFIYIESGSLEVDVVILETRLLKHLRVRYQVFDFIYLSTLSQK